MIHSIKKHYISILVGTCIVLSLLFFHFRGIIYHDEGYILNSAHRILIGEIPYLDFHFVYTPLSIYLTAGIFKILGESVFSARVLALLISLSSILVVFLITKQITKSIYILLLSISMFLVWGPFHINFIWPVMIAILTGFLTIYLLQTATNKDYAFVLIAGMTTWLTFLSKQNFGGVILIISFITIFANTNLQKKRNVILYAAGLLVPLTIYIIYLLFSSSLIPFINDFHTYTWERIMINNSLTTSFIYWDRFIPSLGKLLFYTLPLFISLVAIIIATRNKNLLFVYPIMVAAYYLVGIRPTTDYVHLVPLISITGASFAVLLTFVSNKYLKSVIISTAIFLIMLGFYQALFSGYYKWEAPLIKNNNYLPSQKVNILVESKYANEIPQIITSVNNIKKDNDYMYVDRYLPLLYFITDTNNPTKSDLNDITDQYFNDRDKIIDILEEKKVNVIITTDIKNSNISDYLNEEFILNNKINDYFILERHK